MLTEAAPAGPSAITAPVWRVAALATLLLFVDGFDIFMLGKVAPAIAQGFGVPPGAMTVVFTAHQLGLTLGAFLMGPLADRFGRKRMLIWMAALFALGSLGSAMAQSLTQFALLRGFCGVFLAGVMPVTLSLLAEETPAKRRGALLAIAMTGFSAGAAASGIAAAWLLDRYGWQSGFVVGAVLPLLILPLFIVFVPETRRAASAMARKGQGVAAQLSAVFTEGRSAMTALFWVFCILTMGHTALIAAWLPTFFQELGGVPIQRFALIAMLGFFGGSVGTLLIGWAADRFGPIWPRALAHIGNGLGLVLLAQTPADAPLFAILMLVWTLLQSAAISGLNILLIRAYPTAVRATGSGWASGAGRIGGLGAPVIGGLLLAAKLPLASTMALLAVPMLVVALVVLPLLAIVMRRVGPQA